MDIPVRFTCRKCGKGCRFNIDAFDLENDVEIEFEDSVECRYCGTVMGVKATAMLSVDFDISMEDDDTPESDPNQVPLFRGE